MLGEENPLCYLKQHKINKIQMIKGSFHFLVFSNVSANGLSSVIEMKINAKW